MVSAPHPARGQPLNPVGRRPGGRGCGSLEARTGSGSSPSLRRARRATPSAGTRGTGRSAARSAAGACCGRWAWRCRYQPAPPTGRSRPLKPGSTCAAGGCSSSGEGRWRPRRRTRGAAPGPGRPGAVALAVGRRAPMHGFRGFQAFRFPDPLRSTLHSVLSLNSPGNCFAASVDPGCAYSPTGQDVAHRLAQHGST